MSNLTVVYNNETLVVPATTSLDAIKEAMVELFPELRNAEVVRNEQTITFQAKAGTKGMTNMLTVVYNNETLQVPATTQLSAIKEAMVELFPELRNADVVQEGSTVRFAAKAGTKGSGEQLTVVYNSESLVVPATTPLASIKEAMVELFPELRNAEIVQEGSTIKFAAKAGTKGMTNLLTVVYNNESLTVPATTPLDAIKDAMVELFPELRNADVVQEGSTVRFAAKAGTKGSTDNLTVVYNNESLVVPATTSLDAIKEAMVELFPELRNADVVRDGSTVRFAAKAGTKGA